MAFAQEKVYTTNDIFTLPEGQRAELIDGQMYMMAPPNTMHQTLVSEFTITIGNHIRAKGGGCKVFPALFAVFLNDDEKNYVSRIDYGIKLFKYRSAGVREYCRAALLIPASRQKFYLPNKNETGNQNSKCIINRSFIEQKRGHMKKVSVTFNETTDTTGYLFSLAKCVSAVLRSSDYKDYADDIIAASGFAFRMWVDASGLCPSAASIWEFQKQPQWFGNSGLTWGYVQRMWDEDSIEEERRLSAISLIKKSIDENTGAIAWDISGCEWGIITGYDDETATLSTLKINGQEDNIPYEKLGKLDLPILSVLTVTGKGEKSAEEILQNTIKLALAHLSGKEWCDNAKGIEAYDALIHFVLEKLSADTAWNLEYYLGTYGALKWYAWKFFEKYGESYLAYLYKNVYEAWQKAFEVKRSRDVTLPPVQEEIAGLLSAARKAEQEAMKYMSL